MTLSLDVDGKRFMFPSDWQALKYDDSAFHRHQFQNFAGGSKAMDVVALSPDRELWLIEVKDYTLHRRVKRGSPFDEVAAKVRATLAGLAVARVRANDPHERDMADKAMVERGKFVSYCTWINPGMPLDCFRKLSIRGLPPKNCSNASAESIRTPSAMESVRRTMPYPGPLFESAGIHHPFGSSGVMPC